MATKGRVMEEFDEYDDLFDWMLQAVPELRQQLLDGDDNAWYEAEAALRQLSEEYRDCFVLDRPTKHPVGSELKICVMTDRVERGLATFCPQDNPERSQIFHVGRNGALIRGLAEPKTKAWQLKLAGKKFYSMSSEQANPSPRLLIHHADLPRQEISQAEHDANIFEGFVREYRRNKLDRPACK
jgi:hypothetical protein